MIGQELRRRHRNVKRDMIRRGSLLSCLNVRRDLIRKPTAVLLSIVLGIERRNDDKTISVGRIHIFNRLDDPGRFKLSLFCGRISEIVTLPVR